MFTCPKSLKSYWLQYCKTALSPGNMIDANKHLLICTDCQKMVNDITQLIALGMVDYHKEVCGPPATDPLPHFPSNNFLN